MSKCYIFGSGEISDYSAYNIPAEAFIIAADGGLRHILALGRKPSLILGDFDSFDKAELPQDCEIMTVPAEKDDTDMMLAVKTALSRGCSDITLCGALGGRLDHTLANIQTLEYIAQSGGEGCIFSAENTVTLQKKGRKSYEKRDGFYFSLFSLTEEAVITSRGTKYDLTDHTLKRDFPLGVSNEIISPEASVEVKDGMIIVVFAAK